MADIAIIDGDVLCYFACYPRWLGTDIKLDEFGRNLPLSCTVTEDREALTIAWATLNKELINLLDETYCSEYLMAVKGSGNFRDILYPEYKLQRQVDKRGIRDMVEMVRELAVSAGISIRAHGREADDYLRIWQREAVEAGREPVICSIDKDLECIPGMHYNMKTKNLFEVTPLEAKRFAYSQLLSGDPVDNIPGIRGIGPVKAARLLEDCRTEEEMQEVVVLQYLEKYGEKDWKSYLLSNGKMTYIQQHENDYFSIDSWEPAKGL